METEFLFFESTNTLYATGLSFYLLEISEKKFSYIFRGYRKRLVTINGWIYLTEEKLELKCVILTNKYTAQKMKKSLMENFIFVQCQINLGQYKSFEPGFWTLFLSRQLHVQSK